MISIILILAILTSAWTIIGAVNATRNEDDYRPTMLLILIASILWGIFHHMSH